MHDLIDEIDKSDVIKHNLKEIWCEEVKKSETKA